MHIFSRSEVICFAKISPITKRIPIEFNNSYKYLFYEQIYLVYTVPSLVFLDTKPQTNVRVKDENTCCGILLSLKKLTILQWTANRLTQPMNLDIKNFQCFLFQTISWVSKLDSQLYPVITTDSNNSRDISGYLQHKLDTVLPDIKRAQGEVEQRIKTAETLINKAQSSDEKAFNVKNKLHELNQKLTEITTEYQILLQVLIAYFNNLSELDKTAETLNSQFGKATLPNDASLVESLIKEHEASKQAVLEMFKFAQNECEQIINRISRQVLNKTITIGNMVLLHYLYHYRNLRQLQKKTSKN